jgi:two-component system, repressor protein LuxO
MKRNPQPTILFVEDDVVTAAIYQEWLIEEQMEVTLVGTGAVALAYLNQTVPNIILLDLGLPDMNGMEILKFVRQQKINTTVLIITAQNAVEVVVEAMREGATDFLEKPFTQEQLISKLHHALQCHQLPQSVESGENPFKCQKYHNMLGACSEMETIYQIIDNVAPSRATVLIMGESGTGKELCAEAIHLESERKDKPFVAINCGAIQKNLVESELFGHLKGAFTGAMNDRQGATARAHEGTLFLDEIGEMPLDLQTRLLRLMQRGTFKPVGSDHEESVDIRFICATNRDLIAEVLAGQFREDLFYRINVVPMTLPPLRERGFDILLLARMFLHQYVELEKKNFQRFSPEVENIFLYYEWPGNIRQLQNVIHRMVLLNEGSIVTVNMLPEKLLHSRSGKRTRKIAKSTQKNVAVADYPPIITLKQAEKQAIENAMAFCEGHVSKAAKCLDVAPSTLYRKLKQHKISYKHMSS